jgi:DNA polymerase-3 subunit delta'
MYSHILLTSDIQSHLDKYEKKDSIKIIYSDDFKLEHSKEAIREAYISSGVEKVIILAGVKFNIPAQNTLLKVLEEPPKNIVFVVVTNSKSSLLPTIKSRLPIVDKLEKKELKSIAFSMKKYDLATMNQIIKDNKKATKQEAKEFIESLLIDISTQIKLTESELEKFSNAIKLLELNSRPINVITNILLTLLEKKFNKKSSQ